MRTQILIYSCAMHPKFFLLPNFSISVAPCPVIQYPLLAKSIRSFDLEESETQNDETRSATEEIGANTWAH